MKSNAFDSSMMISRRGFLSAAGLGIMSIALTGCGAAGTAAGTKGSTADSAASNSSTSVRVASLKGPTTIGLVHFMDQAASKDSDLANSYSFTLSTAADEVLPSLIKGDIDIALIPANAASVVYNKTKGGITCLDVNTLGVLSVVTGDTSVTSLKDLAGKTVYLTGKGTTPEYVMNYLLDAAGIAGNVTLEFKSEATEVVSVLASDPTAIGVLPQPFATAALVKNQALVAPIDLTEAWDEVSEQTGDDSQLVTGVTVVRNEFLDEYPEAVEEFLKGQSASVDYVNEHPDKAAKLVVEQGILESEAVAQKAIPACHLVCLTGKELKQALAGYLEVLHQADASSVGGALPADDFYYQA
ncbi:ABC transporter substrate-binding protein [Collinsella bouchesdurhonensis]|uniref:ABC transporter substrate-binding protein n=1 Tax=Collinsella bouchesdurhonensis TaxID=1907654 RepID=UPI00058CFAA6|nr:ABC transporter substrate-binding protein [Collinsella bouchesdurhonensis]